jgi:hypothetical protein
MRDITATPRKHAHGSLVDVDALGPGLIPKAFRMSSAGVGSRWHGRSRRCGPSSLTVSGRDVSKVANENLGHGKGRHCVLMIDRELADRR